MLKEYAAKYYFEGNYNCAESVLRAGNDYYELGLHDYDMIMCAAYGGGIHSGNTCGAVLAAAAILSMKYVEAKSHECSDIKPVVNTLLAKTQLTYGSILCQDIKPQSFTDENRCFATVERLCDIIEETINGYGKAPLR